MAYIGTSPSNGVRRVHTYTATASQTTFSGASSEGVTLSYADTNYLDVYQNGILLGSADYTATSGTSVVLAQAASASDLVVIVVYDVFSVADTVSKSSGGTFDSSITIDEDGATVLTIDRATSDGNIIDLQKDGTTVGSIGVNTKLYIGGSGETHTTGVSFQGSGTSTNRNISPSDGSGALVDGAINLGSSSYRWNSLWLSGGAYIGGTGSANYLDDYEEGTFVPKFTFGGGSSGQSYSSVRNGFYTKIGDTVFITVRLELTARGSSTGTIRIADLPFTSISTSNSNSGFYIGYMANVSGNFDTNNIHLVIDPNETVITFRQMSSGSSVDMAESNFGNSSQVIVSGFYRTA